MRANITRLILKFGAHDVKDHHDPALVGLVPCRVGLRIAKHRKLALFPAANFWTHLKATVRQRGWNLKTKVAAIDDSVAKFSLG